MRRRQGNPLENSFKIHSKFAAANSGLRKFAGKFVWEPKLCNRPYAWISPLAATVVPTRSWWTTLHVSMRLYNKIALFNAAGELWKHNINDKVHQRRPCRQADQRYQRDVQLKISGANWICKHGEPPLSSYFDKPGKFHTGIVKAGGASSYVWKNKATGDVREFVHMNEITGRDEL